MTIESLNEKVLEKLNILAKGATQLIGCFGSYTSTSIKFPQSLKEDLQASYEDVTTLRESYEVESVGILAEYYMGGPNQPTLTDFFKILSSGSFEPKIECNYKIIKTVFEKMKAILTEATSQTLSHGPEEVAKSIKSVEENADLIADLNVVNILLEKFTGIRTTPDVYITNYDYCKCGRQMDIIASEVSCSFCGKFRSLNGTIFEIGQSDIADKKGKYGDHDKHNYLEKHLNSILTITPKFFPDAEMDKIRYCFNRDFKNCPDIANVSHIRAILAEVKLTKYNNFAPLFLKYMTGRSPPQMTYEERQTFNEDYKLILSHYSVLKDKSNGFYVPYYIYKLVEYHFAGTEKIELLNWIHLQDDDTLCKDDIKYKEICDAEVKFRGRYRPTDPSRAISREVKRNKQRS